MTFVLEYKYTLNEQFNEHPQKIRLIISGKYLAILNVLSIRPACK